MSGGGGGGGGGSGGAVVSSWSSLPKWSTRVVLQITHLLRDGAPLDSQKNRAERNNRQVVQARPTPASKGRGGEGRIRDARDVD